VKSAPLHDDRAAGKAGALDKRTPPSRRARGLGREATARASVAAGEVRLAGFKTLDMARRLGGLKAAAPILGISAAVILWLVSLGHIHPGAMRDLGLITVLPLTFFAALVILTVSFITLVHRRATSTPLLAAHALALIAFLHATPAIVYGTLRYAWSWKLVGLVDYVVQHGSVSGAPTLTVHLDVYHYWPSFFALTGLLTELAGVGNAIELASWAPVFNNVLLLGAVLFVFSSLTSDRRIVWLATWIFFLASWVGQDYFSPQAFAYFLYLVVMGVVLRWLANPPRGGRQRVGSASLGATVASSVPNSRLRAWWQAQLRDERLPTRLAIAFVVMALLVINTAHALTSGMVTLALAGLVLARVCRVRSLPLISAGIVGMWAILYASPYIIQQGQGVLETIRLPWLQADHTLAAVGQQSAGQRFITTVSRVLVLAIGGLAALGALRQFRAGRLQRAPVVLAGVPMLLLAGGDYGGEVLFRIYLFTIPFLAFLAAHAFLPRGDAPTKRWWPAIASTGCAVLLGAFLLVYYGKDHQYYFTPKEVRASEYLYAHAPPNALLIDGTANYPRLFEHYERFNYLTLSVEPPPSQRTFLARPATVLSEWMGDRAYNGSFLIITRGQRAEVRDEGAMPPHSLGRIVSSLSRSPKFDVWYRNRDAIIFTLARDRQAAPAADRRGGPA
jgi:hypothetical protein